VEFTVADPVALSKLLAYGLRHRPDALGVTLDAHGWARLDHVLAGVRACRGFGDVTAAEVEALARGGSRRRFEIVDGRIRARYGHSIPERVTHPAGEPPDVLYHGTARRAVASILRNGLHSGGRQYVHLSGTVELARQVGRRHDPDPVVLVVDAAAAARAGVVFRPVDEHVWLVDAVPPEHVRRT
jgi:putative RNA 2'-phosphotransferase